MVNNVAIKYAIYVSLDIRYRAAITEVKYDKAYVGTYQLVAETDFELSKHYNKINNRTFSL